MWVNLFSTKIIKERKRFLLVFLFNLLALSPLIVFSHVHYSIDSYGLIDQWANTDWYVSCFRYFGAAITSIVSFLGHNPILNPTTDIVFYIVIAAASVTILSVYFFKLLKHFKRKIVLFCIIEFSLLITVVNVWYTDILTFAECIAFNAVGLFLCFFAVYLYANSQHIVSLVVSSILFICAAACFQQFISIFVIYTISILCIKLVQEKQYSLKGIIWFYLKPFLFIVVNSVLYYLIGVGLQKIMNIAPNVRASLSLTTILDNLIYFVKQQHSFLKGRGVFSTEVLTVCYLIVTVIFVISLVLFWKKTRRTGTIVFIAISFFAAYLCAYLPGMVSTSHGTRTVCALFSVFALFSIGAVALCRHKVLSAVLICILFTVFELNIYKTVDMEVNQIVGNIEEDTYAKNIIEAVTKYEQKNFISIDYIGICYDNHGDAEGEALYYDFAIEPLIQMNSKKEISFIETPDRIVNTYYKGKDWNYFNADEQIVYDKNVAYICVY